LLYIEYLWFPVTCFDFWNSFCEWLGKTNLCQNLRASRFKLFWGNPLAPAPKIEFVWPLSHPLFCHLYARKKPFEPAPPPQSNTRCLRNIPIWLCSSKFFLK
jgi:hypothetical protein